MTEAPSPATSAADCATCALAGESNGARCTLRDVAIADPANTSCGSHTSFTKRPDRVPIGPVIQRGSGESSIIHESPDSEAIRRKLLDVVENIEVNDVSLASPREAAAIWQLQAFGERRAHVHLDRILTPASAGLESPLSTLLRGGIVPRVVDPVGDARDDKGRSLPERLTLPGRLLVLASLAIGAAAFFLAFFLLSEEGRPRVRSCFVWSFAAAGAAATGGAWIFRRLGIAMMLEDVGPNPSASKRDA